MDSQNNHRMNNSQPSRITANELGELFQNPNNADPELIKKDVRMNADPELIKKDVRMTARDFNEILAQNANGDDPGLKIMKSLGQFIAGVQFDPKQFEGKRVDEYRLPSDFFSQKIIESDDLFENRTELLFSINGPSAPSILMCILAVIPGICILLFGLFLVYDSFYGTNGQELSGAILPLVFGGIWTLYAVFRLVSAIKHSVNFYWFKLTNRGFECYFGKRFDSQKAKKFSLDDPPSIYFDHISTENTTQSSRYAQSDPEMDVVIKDQSKEYVIEQAEEQLANYLKEFLEFYMSQIKGE